MNKKNILGNPQHYGVWVGEFLNVTFNDNPPLLINNHGNNIDSNQLTRRHTETHRDVHSTASRCKWWDFEFTTMMHRDRSGHTTWIVIIASVKLLMSIIIGSKSSDWLLPAYSILHINQLCLLTKISRCSNVYRIYIKWKGDVQPGGLACFLAQS